MELNKTKVSDLAAKLGTSSEVLSKYLTGESSEEAAQFGDSLSKIEVFSADDLSKRDENLISNALKGREGVIKGSVLGDLDKQIAQATGVEKTEGEKTADYIQRAFSEKYKAEGKKPNEEIESLRTKLSEKDNAIKSLTGEIDGLKDQYSKEKNQFVIDSKLESYINSIPIDAKEEMIPAKREFLKYQLLKEYEPAIEDGQLVFKKEGKVVTDNRTASPLDPAKIVKDNASRFVEIKTEQQQKPNGSGFRNKPIDPKSSLKDGVDYSQYASLNEVKDHLTKSGIELHKKEAQDFIAGFITHQREAQNA